MALQMRPELEALCGDIIKSFEGELTWKWDGRFNTVLIEFKSEYNERMLSLIDRHLAHTWNSSNIEKAPDIVKVISSTMGSLRPGQTLYTSDPGQDSVVFCAWWPWGNGSTVSIRLAPWYENLSDHDMSEVLTQLKEKFGI